MRYSARDTERLIKYFKNPTLHQLSDSELKQLERWNFIDGLIRQGHERKNIVILLKNKFNVEQAQAYRDIIDTKSFFGSMTIESKVYDKMVVIEDLTRLAKMAMNKGDYKAAILAKKAILEHIGVDDENKLDFKKIMENFSEAGLQVSIIYGGETITTDITKIEDGQYSDITNLVNNTPTVSTTEMEKILKDHESRD